MEGEVHHPAVVPDGMSSRRAAQAPGLVVHSKPAGGRVPLPFDCLICDSDVDHPAPLHLPVAAPSQSSSTQQLAEALEPVWVVWVLLIVSDCRHAPLVLGHSQLSVGGVWIQDQSTGN